MPKPARVDATADALLWIVRLKARHGPLAFYQSSGCCEGFSPICSRQDELWVGPQDVLLGEIAGCPFYIRENQFEYWRHTQLIIDVVRGRRQWFFHRGARRHKFSHPEPGLHRRRVRGARRGGRTAEGGVISPAEGAARRLRPYPSSAKPDA